MTSPLTSTSSLFGSTSTATTSTTGSSGASTSASSLPSGALDQNSFLQLLMAQMQNQDPTAPTDSTTFVTQLAQFTEVQQVSAQTSTLSSIQTQLQSMGNSQAYALVGKTVTVNSNMMTSNGSFASPATVTLGSAASGVSIAVQDSSGNTVRTMTAGAAPAGAYQITWDGKEDNGSSAPAGTYTAQVTATGNNGQAVGITTTSTGVVQQVAISNGTPTLTLANGAVAPVSQLAGVVSSAGSTTSNP
jgi:flagellar basal-body rod modification protein FlgD